MSQIIKLNIGGKHFETTEFTLNNSEYFKKLLSYHDKSKEIFIDRSYENFEHILALLRDTQHNFPDDLNYELVFYGINFTPVTSKDETTEKINNLEKIIKQIANKINEYSSNMHIDICNEDNCIEIIGKSDRYCDEHNICHIENCVNNKIEHSNYCEKHRCFYCNEKKYGSSDYCLDHKCVVDGCDEQKCNKPKFIYGENESNCCYDHYLLCDVYGCTNERMMFRTKCENH